MNTAAIQLMNVHKHYGKVHALRGIDLEVRQGEIFGFLGPNGAGKTTTIRCMLDLIRPDQGTIEIFGINPQEKPEAVKAKVGYLPGNLHLDGNFTPREYLKYLRNLRKDKRPIKEIVTIAERMDLSLDKKIKTLSQGNKQKVGLIQAFVGDVSLLFLDEPTLGLDPLMQQEVLNLVREQVEKGTTVFFSSHILSEVQKIADRVGIIRKGKLVEIAHTENLISRSITRATVQFSEVIAATSFDQLKNVSVLRVNDHGKSFTLEVKGEMDHFIKILGKYPVKDLSIHRPSLEEVFLKSYQDVEGEG